jgi:hypothetical protein
MASIERNQLYKYNELTIQRTFTFITDNIQPTTVLKVCTDDHSRNQYDTLYLCNNNLKLTYKVDKIYKNPTINVIVIPDNTHHIWEQIVFTFNTQSRHKVFILHNMHLFKADILSEINTLIVRNGLLQDMHKILQTNLIRINKLFMICIESLSLPHDLVLQYSFMWIHSLFIRDFLSRSNENDKTLHNLLLRRKGFIKAILCDIKILPTSIVDNLVINGEQDTEEPECVNDHTVIYCKPCKDITKCLEDNDITGAVQIIKPTVECDEVAAMQHLFNSKLNIVKHIDCQIYILKHQPYSHTGKQRIETLNEKKKQHQLKQDQLTIRITDNAICNVCLESINNKTILKCCYNSFCFTCINKWFQYHTVCPTCRKEVDITKDQVMILSSNNTGIISEQSLSNMNTEVENFFVLMRSFTASQKVLLYHRDKAFQKIMKLEAIEYVNITSIRPNTNKRKNNFQTIFMNDDSLKSFTELVLDRSLSFTDVVFFNETPLYLKAFILRNINKQNNKKLQVWHFKLCDDHVL